ncbi:transcription initiation factor TFIID subunit 1 isoform X4 [Physcomitrium patens]|uniref:Transcription initiation factor TFIID subunit 1 n=1 Tax=Physcomitrium patens TaxID=3218 RepID=A0A7I4A1U4_PHYPA|nr:transcription initiation factor TFIID subunit 1-like isoform X4 [Physcomitrium patens]|eukprot:XP_024386328.1 transcription initiation factor TFIID subunit 1-like isoform X4 [Physcomitrella patens]
MNINAAVGLEVGTLMGDIFKENSERDYDEEEEDGDGDGEGRGEQMLGFMFGNVDDSGGLDEEYLDQDAKEHLSALAHQLGPSLFDIEQLCAKRKRLTDASAADEHEDYDQKAVDAVDYEDIQEQYEGPEVQLAPQDMQFYAESALARSVKLVEEDNYDEDEDFDSEQPTEAKVEDWDFDSEQPDGSKMESPVKIAPETDDEALLTQEDEEEVPVAQEQCRTSAVDMMASDDEDEKEEDWDQILGSQETTSSSREQEDEAAKISLPVLCQEGGKTVLRFSELFGVREPYWVIGHRKGRQKRVHSREKRERLEEDLEAMEDDEEAVLKRCSQQPVIAADSSTAEGSLGSSSEDFDIGNRSEEDGNQTALFISHSRRDRTKQKKLVFTASEPMKGDEDSYEEDIAECRRQIPDANFDLIHQVEWEDDIIWDTSDVSRRGASISDHRSTCHLVEVDRDTEQSHLSDVDLQCLVKEQCDTRLSDCSDWRRPYVVEPLCQKCRDIEDEDELTMPAKTVRHPQMLRLETLRFHREPGEESRSALLRRINNTTLEVKEKNQELTRGSWLGSIFWGEPESGLPRSKVIFDLMDSQMVFETTEANDGQSICLHAAAVVLTAVGKDGVSDGAEEAVNTSLPLTRFNISNDKYYTNKKTHQQQKSNAKKRAIHGVKVMHSLPAIKLQSMKPKLSNKDLANFHRPKAVWYPHHNEVAAKEQGKLAARGSMKVIVKTLGGKGSKLTVDASETLDVLKAKTAKKLGGKELVDGYTFAQQQVPPNSVLHLVRTKIYPWPKAQRLPGENKPLRPPGAFKKKSELSVKDGHVALMEYCEERPLLLGNVGMGGRLFTYYRKRSSTDATAATLRAERGPWVGITLPLEPTEDSPFLGDIRPGETQSSLETNMYRAPIFPHKVATTDFLLVRSPKGKLSLRRIDSIHVVGQQEPHMEVLTPTSKSVQNHVGNRLLVYLYREFREKEKPGVITPHVRADDVTSQFPSLTEGFIRKRLKHCADLQKVGGEMCWMMRRNFRIPSEEEMRRLVTPENVCTYESMQAGLHHLKRMGVHKLTQPSGLAAAMNQLPDEAITLAAASHIERELQITPWNLSSNFVAATMQGRGSLERLEIVGAGDPSGRGLGFSYLRVATKPPNAGALVEKKAAAARGGGAVTGTDADLRRLSMEAAREVLLKFKVPEEIIDKLTRWHRIAMVRKLSSEQAATGVKLGAATLNKFARGQRMSFLQLQQQTREKCQDIWDRQAQSLVMADGDDSESDGEAGGDLDSFAGDLENLLEAEEGDDGGGKKGKREGMGGLGARRRKQIAQQEEDIEDEEAEAAELRRMLRADDEAEEEQKKKKSVPVSMEKKELEAVETPPDLGGEGQAGKKKKKIIKRIIRTRKVDGTYTSKEVIITDPKEVALYLAKKNANKVVNQVVGVEKVGAAKKSTGKPPPVSKKLKSGAPVKEMSAKGKVTGKCGRDALSLVCGACGQLGHMRTNKKCPLYNEEGEPVAWQDSGAAADGLLERQGTKITFKRKPVPIKKMEGLDSPNSAQVPVVKPPLPKKDIPSPVPLLKTPSLRMKIKLISGVSQNPDNSPVPVSKPVREKVEKLSGVHANGAGESGVDQPARPPLLKLKLSNQRRKEHGLKRLKLDQDVKTRKESETTRESERKEREEYEGRMERGDYQKAIDEEMEKDEREKEVRERVKDERERGREERGVRESKRRGTIVHTNGSETNRGMEAEVKFKPFKKKKILRGRVDPELMKRREREREQAERMEREKQEAEEYQRALREELKREQQELEQKEARERVELEERQRKEKEKNDRDRHSQHMKEKEKRQREREAKLREAAELEARKAQEERERQVGEEMRQQQRDREKIREKSLKFKHMKEHTRVASVSLSSLSKRDRGKGIKRRPEVPPSYHPSPDCGNAPKRLRKKGGEVELCNILEGVVEKLKNADCSYLFLKPVPKKEAPDYLHYVKRPMDLSTIRERVRKLKYKSREDFRKDVQQIAENAHLYNDGRNPGIPPLADRLLALCDVELDARDQDLDEAEVGIEPLDDDSKGNSPRLDRRRSVRTI